jgi:hypothetical protein
MKRKYLCIILIAMVALVSVNLLLGVTGCSSENVGTPGEPGLPTETRTPEPTCTCPTPTPTGGSPSPTPTGTETPEPVPTTITYDDRTFSSTPSPIPSSTEIIDYAKFDNVFDLTKGEITVEYDVDTTTLTIPSTGQDSPRVLVGLMNHGAPNFPPGPADTYQGGEGGWMETSLADDITSCNPATLDQMDKFVLTASEGRSETDYDVLNDLIQPTPFGNENYTYGIWFDRDQIPAEDIGSWGYTVNEQGKSYATNGQYHVVITYKAFDSNIGYMMATINDVEQGFWTSEPDGITPPQNYPAGLSFKANMGSLVVFEGLISPNASAGTVTIKNLKVTGIISTGPGPGPTPTETVEPTPTPTETEEPTPEPTDTEEPTPTATPTDES